MSKLLAFTLSLLMSYGVFAKVDSMELKLTSPLTLKTKDGQITLKSGSHAVSREFDFNVFSSNQIILTINKKKINLPVSSSNYKAMKNSGTYFLSAQEMGQTFSLRGTTENKFLGKKRSITKGVSCAYCGYCFAWNSEGKYEWGYNTHCSGTQDMEQEKDQYLKETKMQVIVGNKVIGILQSEDLTEKNVRNIREVTSCE